MARQVNFVLIPLPVAWDLCSLDSPNGLRYHSAQCLTFESLDGRRGYLALKIEFMALILRFGPLTVFHCRE